MQDLNHMRFSITYEQYTTIANSHEINLTTFQRVIFNTFVAVKQIINFLFSDPVTA